MSFFQILLTPFVWLLLTFYNLFSNYGLALILFALVVKCILFPFSLKGKKGMIQMTMVSGKMQQLQKKYANDKERQNLEIQKLYEREKINPMSGCLWSMLPMLVLLPLYAIIREPLTYLMSQTAEQIILIANSLNWDTLSVSMHWTTAEAIQKGLEATKNAAVVSGYTNGGYNQLFLSSLITPETLAAAQGAVGEAASKIFPINFNFIGVNLSQVPNWKFWENGITINSIGLFLVPIISAVTGLFFSFISMKTNAVNNQAASAQSNSTNRMMMIMMPVMSLWIGFAMPAGLGVYWICNNLFSMVQELVCGKILKKDYAAAALAREAQEQAEKEEEKEKKRQARERKVAALEENKGKKKKPTLEKKPVVSGVSGASRVGIRAYARGRAYDPNRFSPNGPTEYRTPGTPIEEGAKEKELEAETLLLEQAAFEVAADDMIMDELSGEKVETNTENGDQWEAETSWKKEDTSDEEDERED